MSNVPAVRFKGFTDPWEQRKLGELCEINSGRDYKHLGEGDIPVYGTGGYMLSVDEALSYHHDAVGIGRKGTIDKPYKLRAPFWTVDTLFYCIPEDSVDLGFLVGLFLNVDWASKDESTGLPSLSKTIINDVDVMVPKPKEQAAISGIFDRLDNLITLHQRKYDRLVVLKKALLDKMFPRDDSDVPEIRFAGFTDPWEQRKLGELCEINSGRDYKHLGEGDIPVYGTGGYMLSVDEALSYHHDAVGIGRKGTIDKPYKLRAPFWTVDTLFYCIPEDSVDLGFLVGLFLNVDWASKDESTGLPSLSKTIINDVDVMVPKPKEQAAISGIFDRLDNLITLHQRKLALLKNLKAACLDKMFV